MKKLLILILSISLLHAEEAPSWIDKNITQRIKESIYSHQEKLRMARGRDREALAKRKKPLAIKPEPKTPPELELWYKGHKQRGKATTDLKPLYYKLGYIYDYPQGSIFVTEGEYSTPSFHKLDPSGRKSSHLLGRERWLLITDKEKPGPGDTLYKFEFPSSRKMLVRIRLVEPGEKPTNTMELNGKTYLIGPQTGPLKGLKGKTETGISLKGNIEEKNIFPEKLSWNEVVELQIRTTGPIYYPHNV